MQNQVTVLLRNNDKDDFVGFEYLNNTITIYYPITLNLFDDNKDHLLDFDKDKQIINELSLFIRSFALADSEDRVTDKSPNDKSDEEPISYPIDAYQYMIDDYHRNGRYFEFEDKYTINGNGKIEWKRTMQRQPIISNNRPIYLDLVTKQKNLVDNIMNDIYLFCVYESVFKFGSWFYGMNCSSIPTKYKRLEPSVKKLYINTIKQRMANTFNDDTLKRLDNMLMIVKGANEDIGIQRIGLKSYHSVFEKLIKWGLDNVGDLGIYNPRAHWSDGVQREDMSPLRLDALRIENNCAFILDAKFYQSSYPGSADINKQITYGENLYLNVINNKYDKNKIYNIFISPRKQNELIINSGLKANGTWKKNNKSFETVYLLHANLKELLMLWNQNNNSGLVSNFRQVVNQIATIEN